MHIHKLTHSSQTHDPHYTVGRTTSFTTTLTLTQGWILSSSIQSLSFSLIVGDENLRLTSVSILFLLSVSVSILSPLVCRNFRFQISESAVAICWGAIDSFQGVSLCLMHNLQYVVCVCNFVVVNLFWTFRLQTMNSNFPPACTWNFECFESCSLQVTESTRIRRLHMLSKAMRGLLMNLPNITMKEVTVIYILHRVFFKFTPQSVQVQLTKTIEKLHRYITTCLLTDLIAVICTCAYVPSGNSQYSQQQAQYQQGSGPQQPFSQQQYSSQQGYSGQPQGYG